jgi:type I restriction-modification system DNA methylase subunit
VPSRITSPDEIRHLVERFTLNLEAYRSGQYNETQLRREFLDPFFSALGWDVENKQGYAEAYKDVIHEDAIKVGGATKAPDYCFRIGGTRKFFVEAKKPSVNLRDEISPAYQLRRYAWSAKLPLSILTDFDEFAVYDCRAKPGRADTAATARTLYVEFKEYPERWEEIASIFSREEVLKGSFDRYAESTKAKKGTAEVDDAFLKEIEAWRGTLARTIALRNAELTQRQLNFAVQRTIDRMIFLRICEDRGIETYGALMALLNGEHVYKRLCELFHRADEKYNSGLFHFRKEKDRLEEPDELTLSLNIDDKPLKEIIRNLYYPDSPYEFSVLPADILGQVYEQFLGKVIRLTAGHRAVVEDKPEVKKVGGVYYTPTYIVDYIVKNTVGRLLTPSVLWTSPPYQGGDKEGVKKRALTPKQVSKLRILDPACGSGSFLIGAYQYLLDWHRDWYVNDGAKKWATGRSPALYQVSGGDWRLTTAERKRILLNNIYGVDIDPQAVEVTKLSLLLKVLEGENEQTISRQLKMFHERALPDLGNNIKCGNSLIGPDFYEGKQLSFMDEEERLRINVFDWRKEFKEIMDGGGFNAVVGNPPYIRIQAMKEWAPIEVDFYSEQYESAGSGNYDIYVVFVERGLSLLKSGGVLGLILPHKFFNSKYGERLRTLIARGKHLSHAVHFGDAQVFSGATTYTALMFLQRDPTSEVEFVKVKDIPSWLSGEAQERGKIEAVQVTPAQWNFVVGTGVTLFEKLKEVAVRLGDVASIFVGLQTSADKLYVLQEVGPPKASLVRVRDCNGVVWSLEQEVLRPFLNDVTVASFERPLSHHWLVFPYQFEGAKAKLISAIEMASSYPKTWKYLEHNREALRSREGGKADNDQWHGYIYRKNLTLFDDPKLIVQVISLFGRYAYDDSGLYFSGGGNGPYYGVRWLASPNLHSLHYLQGVLSSPLLDWYLRKISSPFRGGYWSYGKRFIEQLPIHLINFSDPTDKSRHDRMVEMVEEMLTLHKQLASAKTEHEKTALQRQIDATDKQIDQLVYQLYGLTEEETRIVEGAIQ